MKHVLFLFTILSFPLLVFSQNYNHRVLVDNVTFFVERDNIENVVIASNDLIYTVNNVEDNSTGQAGFVLTCTDQSGQVIFHKHYLHPDGGVYLVYGMKEITKDLILVGQSGAFGTQQGFMMSIDMSGAVKWTREFKPNADGNISSELIDLLEVKGITYVLGNSAQEVDGITNYVPYIAATDPGGNVLWSHLYYDNLPSQDYIAADMEYDIGSHNILVVGTNRLVSRKIFSFSVDAQGNPVEPYTNYQMGGTLVEEYVPNIVIDSQEDDNKAMINFSTFDATEPLSTGLQQHASLLEINIDDLSPNWSKIYGIPMDHCHSRSFIKMGDGGYGLVMGCDNISTGSVLVIGGTQSWDEMLMFIKTDKYGNIIPNSCKTYFDANGQNAYYSSIVKESNNSALIVSTRLGDNVLGYTHINNDGETATCSLTYPASSLNVNASEQKGDLIPDFQVESEEIDIIEYDIFSQYIDCEIEPGDVIGVGRIALQTDEEGINLRETLTPNSSEQGISIAPNPTTGLVIINLPIEDVPDTMINIYNPQGQKVKSYYTNTTDRVEVDLSKESNGLYLIQIQQRDKVISKKVLLIK